MKGYVIKTEEIKAIKKAAKKFGTMTINSTMMDGLIEIKNYRKYPQVEEVDIVFKGKIKLHLPYETWVGLDYIQNNSDNISKIRLNRLLKRASFESVKTRASFFGIDLRHFSSIKTVKWDS
jgi:hypothetical protein